MEVKKKDLFIFLFIAAFFIFAFIFIKNKNLYVDEEVHYLQIGRFIQGDFRIYDIITVIPGYHYFYASILKILNVHSISAVRALNMIIGLISIIVFFLLAHEIYGRNSWKRALQYAFFPILFPFFFLIYTDVLSLLFVFLMFYFVLIKKYNLAGFFGILSFFVRQNNVIWMVFMIVFIYCIEKGFRISFRSIAEIFKDCKVFFIGLITSATFFIWNGGFSFGDKLMHKEGIYFGNVFFALFLFLFLFLPLNIKNFFKIKEFVKNNKWMFFVLFGVFLIYMRFFIVDHPYNFKGSDYFLRNIVLQYFIYSAFWKGILFLPIAYSILSLCVIKFKRKEFYFLYLFAVLFLLPMWLIEQRYYFVPFCLFMLFRKEDEGWVEMLSIGFYIVLSGLLFYLIGEGRFFL